MGKFGDEDNVLQKSNDAIDNTLDALTKYLNSEEGKAHADEYFGNIKRVKELRKKRYLQFDEWLKNNDFDNLMYRLINKHGEDYCRRCYDKGYEPHPNNVLSFIFDYVLDRTPEVKVKKLKTIFTTEVHEFLGYYFELMWGQGVGMHVYNKKDLKRLLSL